MWRQEFDLPGQTPELGSISWTKEIFNHRKADMRIKDFFANESLLRVTTAINMLAFHGQQLGSETSDFWTFVNLDVAG